MLAVIVEFSMASILAILSLAFGIVTHIARLRADVRQGGAVAAVVIGSIACGSTLVTAIVLGSSIAAYYTANILPYIR